MRPHRIVRWWQLRREVELAERPEWVGPAEMRKQRAQEQEARVQAELAAMGFKKPGGSRWRPGTAPRPGRADRQRNPDD